jgi:hypothetical protein
MPDKSGSPSVSTIKDASRKFFLILLTVWFLINLLQALFMEVMSDESYYRLFGKYLAWGYYDHPPMVALLTRLSSILFTGNLGIRFFTVLMQIGTLIIIWKIIDIENPEKQDVISFFIIAASISLFSMYGFIAAPDGPLLFFTALFLLAYRKFIRDPGWTTIFLLSFSMAAMIYSKYQAVLVIGFTILSNLKLLRSGRFWFAGIFALILLIPHFHWQTANDFPSLQYHLVDRSEGFRLGYLLEYLPNQLAVFNPLTMGAAAYIMLKNKPSGQFEKALYLQIIGFIIFFLFIALRGHVEPHWTIACSVPMIIILTEKCRTDPRILRYVRKFILPTLLLFLAARILTLTDLKFIRYLAFGGKEQEYRELESEAGDLPVVFSGAFQRPSMYSFFTEKEAVPISSLYSRQTQFDIWQFEKKYNNKAAFVCINPLGNSKIYASDTIKFGGYRTDSLQTVNRIKISYDLNQKEFKPGDNVDVDYIMTNPYDCNIDFNHRHFPASLNIVLVKGKELYLLEADQEDPVNMIRAGETVSGTLHTVIPEINGGKYSFGLSLNNAFGPSLNSRFVKIIIRKND